MKSTRFFRPLISLTILFASAAAAEACGPYSPIIPTPEFLRLTGQPKDMGLYEREENLRLWQSLTDECIPLSDIEEVVYHDSLEDFFRRTDSPPEKSRNLFYAYLNNSHDMEIVDFLATAKILEKRWAEIRSPWNYPRSRVYNGEPGDFSELIEYCRRQTGGRLKDRYALQATRALFASRRYADCIEYVDSAFASIPDDNLMKRMAQRYAAGCWKRLGQAERADSMFSMTGDIWSISNDNPARYMLKRRPNAPQLMEYIRTKAADSTLMCSLYPDVKRLINKRTLTYTGDWNFLLAYIDNEYKQRGKDAHKLIHKALGQRFSSEEMKNLARAYRMKLDAESGDSRSLLDDLKWIECQTGLLNPDAEEWIRRCQNVVYEYWVPRLWKEKDYGTAILLCSYAENLSPSCRTHPTVQKEGVMPIKGYSTAERRWSENGIDYGSLSFQLMGSLSSQQLAASYGSILSNTPLHEFLRRKACTDKDYYYELIGTLALREENYSKAEEYLSKVGIGYLKGMNIDRDGYLSRDPFDPYPSRWRTNEPLYEGADPWEWEDATKKHGSDSNPEAKLKFARKMKEYRRQMEQGSSADERGLARLMYAIGRRNSFEECWALTQYWRGLAGIFRPELEYWEDDFAKKNYPFLYDYVKTTGHKATERIYEEEIKGALSMLATDEARAKAHYILRNLKSVVRDYGTTSTAQFVKASCDRWESWL